MYKPVTSLVNGEIIKDLLDMCNEQFIDPFVRPYAGANAECMFCGAFERRARGVNHSGDCPVIKYQNLVEKHKRFIVKI